MADNEQKAASQLDIESQINKVLQARTAILQNQSKFLSNQTQMAMEMCNALDCEGLDGMKDRLDELQNGLSEAAEEAKRLEGSAQSAGNAVNSMAKKSAKDGGMMKKAFSPMGGMFAGLGVGIMSAFKGATNMVGGFLASAGRITGIIGNVGKSLIALPFNLLNNLTSLAAGAGGGVSALRQAMEDVREEFGSLAKNEGKQVMDGFGAMKSQFKDMAGAGISIRKHFGPGSEGAAAALKAVGEQMTDLGESMGVFGDEVAKNAGKLHVYRKGLGLTGDAFKSMATVAQTNGKSLTDTVHEFGSMAINMGKQYDIGPKQLSKAMASMAGDVANFGTLSTKQLASLAVYTNKLGIEAKELSGVIDKFDNFEDAAKSASQLSQAFGMNIDAMQMMKEQDPGKRMDMLRESFQATGKSVEDLSRQELKLLAAQMGLSEEAAKKALSSDMDYDDIVAGSEDAEAKTLSQAEAMKELADSLKQVFGGGGGGPKTFTEALVSGFKKGIMRGKGMRKMFSNIRKSMRQVYLFGKDLGKMFIEMFPGIQTMVKALTDLFSPSRFKKLRKDLLGAFRQLFIDLRTDPKAGVETFSTKIKEIFGKFFDSSSGPGKAFMDGLKTFGKTVLLLILSMVPMLMKGLASLIKKLADFIRDPSALTDGAAGLADGLQQALAGAFENIKAAWPILRDAFYDLWDAVKPALGKLWQKMWPYILSAVILKTIITVAANMTLGAVFGTLFKAVAKLFSGAFAKGSAAGTKGAAKNMKKKGSAIGSVKGLIYRLADFKVSKIGKAMLTVGMLIVFVGVSLVGLAFALKLAIGQIKDVDPVQLAVMGAILIALMFAMLPMALAAEAMGKVNLGKILGALLKTGLIVTGMGALTYIMSKIISAIEPPPMEAIKGFFIVMGLILVMGLVAMALAIPAGMLADKFGVQIAIGLAIIGVVMIAMGVLGVIIGKMLGSIPNPEGVAALMQGISSIMKTTAMMLPIAGALGLMAMAFPFGTAGVAIIVAGFGILGTLATSMVNNLIPAMEKIAKIKVGDPKSFKMVTEALLAVIHAIEGFVNAVARVMEALRPSLADLVAGKSMEDNIKAATEFVDAVLKNGIMPLINKIIEVAESTSISENGVQAVKAIGEILKAVGSILQSMMPDPEVIKAVASMDSWFGSGRAVEMMEKVTKYMEQAQKGAMCLIEKVKTSFFSPEFIKLFDDVDPNAAAMISAFGPIIEGVAKALDALKPSDEQMKTVQKSRGFWGTNQGPEMMKLMTEYMKATEEPIKGLINAIGTNMKDIINSIKPIIKDIGSMNVDPKALEAVTRLVVAVMEGMGNMMAGVGPIVQSVTKIADKFSNASAVMAYQLRNIGDMIGKLGPAFTSMMPSITSILEEMVKVAQGIKNPEEFGKKVESIVKIFDMLNMIVDMFAGKDAKLNAYGTATESFDDTSIGALKHNLTQFNKAILKDTGPLQTFINKMLGLNIPKGGEKKAEALGNVFKALGIVLDGVTKFKEFAPKRSTAANNDSGAMKEINQAIHYMQKIDFDGIKTVMEKVGSGNWDFNKNKIKYRADGAEEYQRFITAALSAGKIEPGTTNFGTQETKIGFLKSAVETAGGGNWDSSNKLIQSRTTMVQNFTLFVSSLKDAIREINRMPIMDFSLWEKIDMSMFYVSWAAERAGWWFTSDITTTMNSAVNVVQSIADNFNEINDILKDLPMIEIDASLNEFGRNMRVATKNIKIQNKPVNIKVDLKVTMNANDIALQLSDSARPNGKHTISLSRKGSTKQGWSGAAPE